MYYGYHTIIGNHGATIAISCRELLCFYTSNRRAQRLQSSVIGFITHQKYGCNSFYMWFV